MRDCGASRMNRQTDRKTGRQAGNLRTTLLHFMMFSESHVVGDKNIQQLKLLIGLMSNASTVHIIF